MNDTYNGNIAVKRDGAVQEYTKLDVNEYVKCSKDPSYFAINYCKVINLDKGLVPFDLYPYQREMFNHFNDNRFSIVLACRQSGKSISSVAYLLWYAIFHPDQTIAVLANKGATAQEMLGRVTLMLENLPFFLQPGTKALNKRSIEFSNNSRIVSAATSGSSIRGMSVNLLYLDEFAFVEDAATFYTSTYPVIASGKNTKVIITSTANGIGNMFHKLW
jgi:phage terminase large subunit-like protein